MTQGHECRKKLRQCVCVCVFFMILETGEKEREGAEGVTRQLWLGLPAPRDALYPAD